MLEVEHLWNGCFKKDEPTRSTIALTRYWFCLQSSFKLSEFFKTRLHLVFERNDGWFGHEDWRLFFGLHQRAPKHISRSYTSQKDTNHINFAEYYSIITNTKTLKSCKPQQSASIVNVISAIQIKYITSLMIPILNTHVWVKQTVEFSTVLVL